MTHLKHYHLKQKQLCNIPPLHSHCLSVHKPIRAGINPSKSYSVQTLNQPRFRRTRKHKRQIPIPPKDSEWPKKTELERLDDWDRVQHRFLHISSLQFEARYGVKLANLVETHNALHQYQLLKRLSNPHILNTNSKDNYLTRSFQCALQDAALLNQSYIAMIHDNDIQSFKSTNSIVNSKTQQVYHSHDSSMPIVIDTGSSVSVTPNKEDFVGKITQCSLHSLQGLQGEAKVEGMGTIEWTIQDLLGTIRTIRTKAYYVPGASVRLFSPQAMFMQHKAGCLLVEHSHCTLELPGSSHLIFPYHDNNIPFMLESVGTTAGLTSSDLAYLSSPRIQANLTVSDENNQNLTTAERERLLYHFKLGHAHFQWVQRLLSQPRDPNEAPILPSKHKGASTTQRPILCAACELGKQGRRTPTSEHSTHDHEMAIRSGDLQPGDKVSIDNYQSALPGRLVHTKGREPKSKQYNGGTIFCDHASGVIYIVNQISLRAGETTMSKQKFEQWAREHNVPKIKSYRADNVPFNSDRFQQDLRLNEQTIDFSGVGAHHQNAVAERAIQTITKWARTMLLHHVIHWPDQADLTLWPFAMEHAVYIWNNLPRRDSRLSPIEVFTRTKKPNHNDLSSLHVWGCPTYVLEPKLQDMKKLPKWNPRTRRGMYLGFAPSHSSTVSRILNLRTGHVSPQYHFVCDDHFSTVPNAELGGIINPERNFDAASWGRLVESGHENHLDDLADGDPIPPLHDDWLEEQERQIRQNTRALNRQRARIRQRMEQLQPVHEIPQVQDPFLPQQNPPIIQQQQDPEQNPPFEPEGAIDDPPLEEQEEVPLPEEPLGRGHRPRRPNPRFIGDEWTQTAYPQANYTTQKVRQSVLNNQFLATLDWHDTIKLLKSNEFASMWNQCMRQMDISNHTFEWLHPLILAAKANAEDNPTWEEAMNGPLADGYWEAACKEIATLERMEVWDVVDKEPWMNVLPSTWALKCKRYPDGRVRKLKGRFCCRGDKQIDGLDYDSQEIFSPVVSWNTVRLLLILSLVLGLSTKQVDYTAAFVHAPIGNKEVYVEMPRGFTQPGKVLRLKKSLYGLKQSPVNFYNFIKDKLESIGFVNQQDVDQCLFISDKVVCLVYVDDTLFFSPEEKYIDEAIEQLQKAQVTVEVEDSVAGFLGVHIERDNERQSIKMTQSGLTKRIVEALKLEHKPIKHTPTVKEPLAKDPEGDPPNGNYSYPSVVGMMLYLSGHSRPDIQFAVSQVARFLHSTKRSHEEALERIGQYLKGTMDEGLILTPTGDFNLECHVDADFAGLYGTEQVHDPISVKSRTGFVISFSGCPVLWTSRLQTDIALSTMEAEYNALSTAMKDLLPLRTLLQTIAKGIGIDDHLITTFKTTVYEDNMGCLKLANLKPGQYTPRSKHYAVKYHWFRSHLQPSNTTVQYIETSKQKADILTKGLTVAKFREIRKLLCGW